jgi:putative PIN family toxin of toxin-antitoxin system
MTLVLDTDVVVAGFRSPTGASAALLQLVDEGKVELLLSVALVLEYESVLIRHEHLEAASASEAAARLTLDALVELGRPAWIDFYWRPKTMDPGDEMVLEAAINGKADAIVTFNRRHFGNAPGEFGIECWLPREALEKAR